MAVTEKGYERPTYQDILDDLILKAKELIGEDIETGEQSILGKFLRIIAYDRANAEEEAEQIYYARFPNTASGVSLDRLCAFVGISRNAATAAQYKAEVTAKVGTVIPYGDDFLTSTDNDITFYNTEEVTVTADDVVADDTETSEDTEQYGTVEIILECTESGEEGNVDIEEITMFETDADIESVTVTARITDGEEAETDASLRKRFVEASKGLGSCNEAAVKAAIIRAGASSVTINVDEDTGSFEAVVVGGTDSDVVTAIFNSKPLGIKSTGEISVEITDDYGVEHTISFSRPEEVTVSLSIHITTNTEYEGDTATAEIKESIAEYINALEIGEILIRSKLYGIIYSITGIEEVTYIGTRTTTTDCYAEDVSVTETQIIVTEKTNIRVTVE